MVKAAKFLVLIGAIAGLAGFFLPFISVESQGASASVSAFQGVRGVAALEKGVDAVPDAQARKDLDDILTKVKGFLYGIYAPSLVMLLFALIGVIKGKFGRGFAVLSLLMGGLSLGVWVLISSVASEAGSGTEGSAAIGMGIHMLAIAGALGGFGGLVNTVKPDHG